MVKLTQKGGNKVLDIILWIFAVVGIIAVIYLVIVYITNLINSSSSSTTNADSYPPNSYMVKTGLNCPDYWIKVASSDGKVHCRNTYGLPMEETSCENVQSFSEIDGNNWITSEDRSTIPGVSERCGWLNKCGGVWQGVQDYC